MLELVLPEDVGAVIGGGDASSGGRRGARDRTIGLQLAGDGVSERWYGSGQRSEARFQLLVQHASELIMAVGKPCQVDGRTSRLMRLQ
jgi:hypothetical protein